jgi:hypothetical protein
VEEVVHSCTFPADFLFVEKTSTALKNIGYQTYIIFVVLNDINAMKVWSLYSETADQTTESIDRLSISDQEDEPPADDKISFVMKTRWSVAKKARALMRERKVRGSKHSSHWLLREKDRMR